jgi:hypothetical protein
MRQHRVYDANYRYPACLVWVLVALSSSLSTFSAWADDSVERITGAQESVSAALGQVEIKKSYALGLNRFDLDAETEMLGWRISNSWYFGRQDGLDSGLTFVYQQEEHQVSVSKDGLRLTRRF